MGSRDLWRWLRADPGLWRGHAWRIAGERGERVGVLQFYADGTGFDELTGEFDVDAWERGSRMLRFPLTRTGWRSAHEAARRIVRRQGGARLVPESSPERRVPLPGPAAHREAA